MPGEYLWTLEAAMREAERLGLRLPTDEEWTEICELIVEHEADSD